ncbi:MAG TPA: hypothetical protein DCM62_03410 [Bacteroidales bacterium]|nr:hypothetical protein [Bacteroidales bacterium]
MEMLLLVLFYLFTPLFILFLTRRYKFANQLGAVIIAYGLGLILGNIGLLPPKSVLLNELMLTQPDITIAEIQAMLQNSQLPNTDVWAFRIYQVRDMLMTIAILMAIPLLLFSTNIKQWKKVAGKDLVSLLLGVTSVVTMVVAGFFIFQNANIPELYKVAGMLIGVYTGGTPNLASLKLALDVSPETYILTHTYDLVIGALYLAFLISIGKVLFRKILPPYPHTGENTQDMDSDKKEPFFSVFQPNYLLPLLKAIGIAVVIAGIGGALSTIVPKNMVMATVILVITTLAILVSLIPSVNKTEKTFATGMYLILIFSIVVASMADLRNMGEISVGLLGYIALAVFGSLTMHLILSKIFKINADTTIITTTALICSPPFVPVIAGALGNRQIVVTGITIGIIGYAIGNYLGVTIALLLR